MQTKKDTLEFSEIGQVEQYLRGNVKCGAEHLKEKMSECLLITLCLYLTELEYIELSVIHLVSNEEGLFDFLLYKF